LKQSLEFLIYIFVIDIRLEKRDDRECGLQGGSRKQVVDIIKQLYGELFTAVEDERLLCSNGKPEALLKSRPARGWLHLGVNTF